MSNPVQVHVSMGPAPTTAVIMWVNFELVGGGSVRIAPGGAASSSGASPGTGAGAESSPEINSQVSPEQVDLIFVHALGWGQFPRHKGGPFFWAEQEIGLAPMALRLKELKEEHP